MANLIDKVKIKAGRLITVQNTKKKKLSNANDIYIAVWVEDSNGKNERCLLFTKHEIEEAQHRADANIEDLTNKTWLTDIVD